MKCGQIAWPQMLVSVASCDCHLFVTLSSVTGGWGGWDSGTEAGLQLSGMSSSPLCRHWRHRGPGSVEGTHGKVQSAETVGKSKYGCRGNSLGGNLAKFWNLQVLYKCFTSALQVVYYKCFTSAFTPLNETQSQVFQGVKALVKHL